jgi:flagellin-like hook-associated protein FlgL
MSSASSANIQILQIANEQFQVAQKRVSTGKMVFGAADDATRYRMSETMLGRQRQISDINNNVSLGLKTLEATDKTLKQMIGLVESAQNLVRKAQAEGAAGLRSVQSAAGSNVTAATSSAGVVGSRFSITTDDGKNFTYTATAAATAWGTIVDALNSANIGIQAEFIPSTTAGNTTLRFFSTSGRDFTFDATTDQAVMTSLGAITTPTGQTYNANNLFANGTAAAGANESGFTIGYGGVLVGNKAGGITGATAIATGAVLVFQDGNGVTRTYTTTAATLTVANMINEINALNTGVRAELVNQTAGAAGPLQLRFRNTNGGNMQIIAGTNEFATGGALGLTPGPAVGYAAPLSANNALRLAYGQQYDNIIANINAMIVNNPVQAGRNLITGQNMNVVMDEFAGTPITVTGSNLTGAGTVNAALGFTAAAGGNTWTNDANIQTAATQSNGALVLMRDLQARFATFNSYMQDRYDLNKNYATDLKTQGDELVAADMAEESANMTALQTRQQFAVQAFSMGSQTMQGLLRLLG